MNIESHCMSEPKGHEMDFYKNIFRTNTALANLLLVMVFLLTYWIGIFRHIELPGLYMDAINPEYLAARILNPGLSNPIWVYPTKWFPILGNLYHGLQNLYLGIPIFWLLGTNIVAARIEQAIFGGVLIFLVFLIVSGITKSRALAFGSALCLATDIAFLASFRTQNYIILGGMVWLLAAVLPLLRNSDLHFSRKKLLVSGVFFGLAIYGYFVFSFFFPVFIYGVAKGSKKGDRLSGISVWCGGAAIGLFPYILGYLSMGMALGGISQLLLCLKNYIHMLSPFSSNLSLAESYKYILDTVRLAMANGGNEIMIFGKPITAGLWSGVKFWTFIAAILLLLIRLCGSFKKNTLSENSYCFPVVLLPCSYVLFCGILGQRLWAHHFSVMTPLLYMLGALLFNEGALMLFGTKGQYGKIRQAAVVVCFVVVIVGNLGQQNKFFKELDRVGGAGKLSNSLTLLADEALLDPTATAYIFPEWGFFMPFSFLTANRIPYRLELSKPVIDEFRGKYVTVSVAFWDQKNVEKYNTQLMALGFGDSTLRVYHQKDGLPAFYLLTAKL